MKRSKQSSPGSSLGLWVSPIEKFSRKVSLIRMKTAKFKERYVAEMNKTDARQAIKLLAELARATPLRIGCYCENESACHRSILRELIEGSATIRES